MKITVVFHSYEKFSASLSEYRPGQRETVQKAIDSGVLNNTNRTRELVSLVAKLAEEKGISFDFVNNQKLKETGFALEGKTVDGFVTNGNITLNVNSAKTLNTVVGHEIAHVLEGTELYSSLQESITRYAKEKGDYDKKLQTVSELYKDVKDANVEGEVTADLIGEYLFSDKDFVNRLSTENRNVFQKIFDEIKYLCKAATAGSKEARELEKIRHTFEEVYRQSANVNTEANGKVDFLLSKDVDGNIFVDVTEDIFDATNGESVARTIQRVISERFNNLIDANGQKIRINKTTNDEFRRSESATALLKISPQAYNDKLKTIANADEILSAAKNWIGERIKHERNDDIVEFARGNIMYRVGRNGYVADVIVGTKKNGSAVLYDLVNIYDKKIAEAPVTVASNENSQRRQETSAKDMLSQSNKDVNEKLSISSNGDIFTKRGISGKDVALDPAAKAQPEAAKTKKSSKEGDIAPFFTPAESKGRSSLLPDDYAPLLW